MKLTFDTDALIYQTLISAPVASMITGGIYVRERPDDSSKEDIVINTIDLGQTANPQLGTSNVNIHVPDLDANISGVSQKKANLARLKTLTESVVSTLRGASFLVLGGVIDGQNVIAEPEIRQHFANIRISWSIH